MIKTAQSKGAKAKNMSKDIGVTNEVMFFPDREYGSVSFFDYFYKMDVLFVSTIQCNPPVLKLEWGRMGKWRQRWDMSSGHLLPRLSSCFTVGTGSSFSNYKSFSQLPGLLEFRRMKRQNPHNWVRFKRRRQGNSTCTRQPSTTSCNHESGSSEISTVCLFL